jgi:hypothetical protein
METHRKIGYRGIAPRITISALLEVKRLVSRSGCFVLWEGTPYSILKAPEGDTEWPKTLLT